jgi:3-oxoacyl-[acyl-carrier protein] reductase
MRLAEKTAIVTGASRGIGRSIALSLAREGAAVVVNFRKNEEAATQVAGEISKAGGRAACFQADVSDFAQAQDLIAYAVEQFGDLHILVNNAGATRDGLIMTMAEEDWDFVIETNLKSTFNCARAAVRHMIRRRFGRIINISSVAGQMGNPGQTNYSASKAGQIGFTKALAREVASRNITVNAIAPGYIDTDLTRDLPEKTITDILNMVPLKRMGLPEDIAEAAVYLASDQAGYVTGQVLSIDGGMAMF